MDEWYSSMIYVFCWEKTRQLKRARTKALLPQMILRSPSLARKRHIASKNQPYSAMKVTVCSMPTGFTVFSYHFLKIWIQHSPGKKTWKSKLNGKYMEICSSCIRGSILDDGFCRGDKSHQNVWARIVTSWVSCVWCFWDAIYNCFGVVMFEDSKSYRHTAALKCWFMRNVPAKKL